jgi:hypothetical protein
LQGAPCAGWRAVCMQTSHELHTTHQLPKNGLRNAWNLTASCLFTGILTASAASSQANFNRCKSFLAGGNCV